jgi:hypothetical protein
MNPLYVALGLTLFAVLWFAAGAAYSNRRRRAPAEAKLTPAQAMANAPAEQPPAELEPSRFDHTLTAIPPVTQPIPLAPTVTGDLGAATPPVLAIGAPEPAATTKPAEPLQLPPAAPKHVAPQPDPERDAVTLTISHLPPKDNGATVHGRRFTNITPGAELPPAVWVTWATVLSLRDRHGGTVLVAVKRDGRIRHFEPSTEHPNEWPRGAIDALQHAHAPTPAAVPAMSGARSEAWAGRW